MKDGPIRAAIKLAARLFVAVNVAGTRALWRARGDKPYRLGGACQLCAKCCEEPGIQVGRVLWYLPTARRFFLWWQHRVNGFVLKERHVQGRVFVFTCTHFDPETRRCDSYSTRPFMCRDYPRNHLWTGTPALLPGCGYRAVNPNRESLLEALAEEDLAPGQLEKVKERLHLEE